MTNQQFGGPLTRSRQRVLDHGEVFTPSWLVEDMLALVQDETSRIDSRFLEPACGSGNFLIPVLARKLGTVHRLYRSSEFELRHYALLALMSIYGIELLQDNVDECREKLVRFLAFSLKLEPEDILISAADKIVFANIAEGDALSMTSSSGDSIVFPEWSYLGKGKYQRRDFELRALTQRSSVEGTLFGELDQEDIFLPIRVYAPITIQELAK